MKTLPRSGAVAAAAVLALAALAGCQRTEEAARSAADGGGVASAPGVAGRPGAGSTTAAGGSDAGAAGPAAGVPPGMTGDAGSMGGSSAAAGGASAAVVAAPPSKADRSFLTEAATGGLFEAEVSRLAAEKASDPAVKQYASQLATDHGGANAELKQLATARNVSVPTELPPSRKSTLEALAKTNGPAFDKQYVQTVGIRGHQETIKQFEAAARDTKDAELRAWIEKTLPTLREHLAQAQKLPAAADARSS